MAKVETAEKLSAQPQGSETGMRQSYSGRSSMAGNKNDPYALDFNALTKTYAKDAAFKLPFVKSSFIHYANCPIGMIIDGVTFKDELVMTMELVQAPKHLKYKQLTDPKLAKKQQLERKKKEAREKKEAEKAAKRAEKKEEKRIARESNSKQPRRSNTLDLMASARQRSHQSEYDEYVTDYNAKKAAKEAGKKTKAINSDGDEEDENEDPYGEDEAESVELMTLEEFIENKRDQDSDGEMSEDSDEESGSEELDMSYDQEEDSYGSDESGSGNSDESSSSQGSEGDREYTGDMFSKTKPIKFAAGDAEAIGNLNKKMNVNEYICFSLWRNGGSDLRYSRLRDTIIDIPPVQNDQHFRTSHTQKSVYYLGEQTVNDKKKRVLVIICLTDLSHKVIDITKLAVQPDNLDNSSLIMQETHLCFQKTRTIMGKHHEKQQTYFSVVNLAELKEVWECLDVERLFFKADLIDDEAEPVEFGKSVKKDEDDEDLIQIRKEPAKPELIYIVQKKTEECDIDDDKDDKDDDPKAATDKKEKIPMKLSMLVNKKDAAKLREGINAEQAEPKKETRKYFRTYSIEFGEKFDPKAENVELKYESYILAAEKKGHKKDHKEKEKDKGEKKKAAFDVGNAIIFGAIGGQLTDAKDTTKKEKKKKKVEEEILYAVDQDLETLTIIIMGQKGEQHKVIQFQEESEKGKEPFLATTRAGNTYLEFSQDTFIRDKDSLFIIQTENTGICSAKALVWEKSGGVVLPAITMKNASKELRKDAWIGRTTDGKPVLSTLCKSSTDDFLMCESLDCSSIEEKDEDGDHHAKLDKQLANLTKLQKTSKIRPQEIDMNYPCLVYNIGLRQIKVQSIAKPDDVATFCLDDRDFICFTHYRTFADIGLKDKRSTTEKQSIPFEETGNRIAFLTRDNSGPDGAIFLNILLIDTYATPTMTFELSTTDFDAEMSGGTRDDCIYKSFIAQVTSVRGLDVSLINQYNQTIIFDCITSTKQRPIRFPMPLYNTEQERQKLFNADEMLVDWETTLDICKGAFPMKQVMQIDDKGAIYFVCKLQPSGVVKVMRVDPNAEMGNSGFIKAVYTLRCIDFHFLEIKDGFFYLMDDKKKIRKLEQDPMTFMLTQVNALEMPHKDKLSIKYSDFDEFVISSDLIHWDKYAIYVDESKNKCPYTWGKTEVMAENHKFIQGPKVAKGTGMIFYLEKFESFGDEEGDKATDEQSQINAMFDQTLKAKDFKGYSVVMQPLADLSFIDILPQLTTNNNNFSSYIDSNHIMVRFSGRFLVFHNNGQFMGNVKFENMESEFRQEQLKIVCLSDNVKYFVFEGPFFEEKMKKAKKNKADKEETKNQMEVPSPGGLQRLMTARKEQELKEAEELEKKKKKAGRVLYVFKLEYVCNLFNKKPSWKFVEQTMKLDYITNPETRQRTRQSIDHMGVFTQALVEKSDTFGEEAQLEVVVKSYASKPHTATCDKKKPKEGLFQRASEENPMTEEKYIVQFESEQRRDKEQVLDRKIRHADRREALGIASSYDKWRQNMFMERRREIDSVWSFTNYYVIKCGSELKYIERNVTGPLGGKKVGKARNLAINFGSEVWIEDIYSTGVDDLVQIFILNDVKKRYFVLTWNLQMNREHSNFQSTFDEKTNPEYLFLQSYGGNKTENFNIMLDHGAMINLSSNLPVQFFDIENERDWCPELELKSHVHGQKKVQEDYSNYLELVHPGRLQHFISLADLIYWKRFENNKDKHELAKGKMTNFAPIARFPTGISIFHTFATNVKVLEAVNHSMTAALVQTPDDPRLTMLPLMFLHSNPALNKPGQKTTPLHLALDKQSPQSFEIMLNLLKDQKKVCVTSQLLDRLEDMINQNSTVVNEFFDESFFITDQFSGPQALDWTIGENIDEHWVNVPTSFLTTDYLQSLVRGNDAVKVDIDDAEEEKEDHFVQALAFLGSGDSGENDGPAKYSEDTVECLTQDREDQSNLRQVEAKILEFNWIFNGQNAAKFIKILAETNNDDIFATKQIRVMIEFLWTGYYDTIMTQLFYPFLVYFICFSYYVTYLSTEHSNEMDFNFCIEYACLIIAGKMFITFVLLECIQFYREGYEYLMSFWNILDIASLVMNLTYVICEMNNYLEENQINLIGSICIAIMWVKMFYWMRIFKSFAAFIRMVEAITESISVFTIMLFMVLFAFANIIIVLQLNRDGHQGDVDPIYDGFTGYPLFDAFIHAYLTGLGDFGKDNYSAMNGTTVWIFFLFATVIVQLVFMNLLIAMMGDAYASITAIEQQSIMKELCSMMQDNIWLLDIGEIFKHSRYILWLTPDRATASGTVIERQITQLQDFVETKVDSSDTKVLREIQLLNEDMDTIKTQLADIDKTLKEGDEEEDEDY